MRSETATIGAIAYRGLIVAAREDTGIDTGRTPRLPVDTLGGHHRQVLRGCEVSCR